MARRDALLRLHKSLLARRSDLRKKLAGELADLRGLKAADSTGDSADVAFETGSDEMASQLAEFDARELNQIERALARLKQGTYGLCEGCQCKIPVSRLNALPYTTFCIECQREREKYPDWDDPRGGGAWERVSDADTPIEDQRDLRLSDLEMDLSGNR
jgi:DnaK suppressor protein